MMRLALPFAVPVACLVGLIVAPVYADMLGVAIFASALTLALAFPAMYSTAPARLGLPSIDGVSWPHVLWRLGLVSEAALVTWTFVSLAMLVIVPEEAESWSIHLGLSMIILMMWTPVLLFLKPESRPASTEPEEPQTDERDMRQDFVPEERQNIRRRKAAGTAPDADADDEQALWSFGDDSGDGSNRSESVPEMTPNRARTEADQGRSASDASEADNIWTQWPDDEPEKTTAPSHQTPDPDAEARSLWSFSEDDDAFGRSDEAPDPKREARVAADVARTSWEEEEDDDEAMAWDILDTILEEEETGRSEEESSWEPDEWPDFNYDV